VTAGTLSARVWALVNVITVESIAFKSFGTAALVAAGRVCAVSHEVTQILVLLTFINIVAVVPAVPSESLRAGTGEASGQVDALCVFIAVALSGLTLVLIDAGFSRADEALQARALVGARRVGALAVQVVTQVVNTLVHIVTEEAVSIESLLTLAAVAVIQLNTGGIRTTWGFVTLVNGFTFLGADTSFTVELSGSYACV